MYKEEISDLNEEFQDQREAYLKDIREQQLQIDLLNGKILIFFKVRFISWIGPFLDLILVDYLALIQSYF